MTPYWQGADGSVLYHGDAMDVLPELDPFDLLCTDPPYGVSYQSNRRQDRLPQMAGDGDEEVATVVMQSALKKLRRGRHVYWFGPLAHAGLPVCGVVDLVWDKGIIGMGDLSCPWGPEHEPITFAVYEISKANREKGYGKLVARLRQGSVLRYQRRQSGQVRHPSEKPVALMRALIESSSVVGETVCDPFAGSGSTLVAGLLSGRKVVAVELEERYCAIAADRARRVEHALAETGELG
jgi:DNA modification methylase